MHKWIFIFGVVMMFLLLLAVGCGPAATPEPTPTKDLSAGKALVENRCSTCHPVSQVQAARYNQEGWLSVTQRMVSKGAQLTPEQLDQVVEYLAVTYPGQ
jgi:mono/diheme cytochrome c family protein